MGEDATWGRSTVARVRAAPASGCCSRARRFARTTRRSRGSSYDDDGVSQRRLRLRLHAGPGGRRLPAGDVPHLRRRHGVGERREGPAGGLRRHPARPRRRPGACARRWTRTATGSPTCCATPTRSCGRSPAPATIPIAGGLVVAMDKEHADKLADRLARITGERPDIVHSDAADASARIARFSSGSAPLAGVRADGLRGRRRAAPARRRLRHDGTDRAVLPPGDRALHPSHPGAAPEQMSHVFLPSDPRLKKLAIGGRGGAQPRTWNSRARGRAGGRARGAGRDRRGVPRAVLERAPRRGGAAHDRARRRAAALRRARAPPAALAAFTAVTPAAPVEPETRSSIASGCAPNTRRWWR